MHRFLIHENTRHFVWFSGGGFHFWIPLRDTFTPSDGYSVARVKEGGRKLISRWHKKLNLSCNDPTVAFDTSGMIRIPNSYNSKRGCWSIPLDSHTILNLTHDEIMEKAGGIGKFQIFVVYLGIGSGINSILGWLAF